MSAERLSQRPFLGCSPAKGLQVVCCCLKLPRRARVEIGFVRPALQWALDPDIAACEPGTVRWTGDKPSRRPLQLFRLNYLRHGSGGPCPCGQYCWSGFQGSYWRPQPLRPPLQAASADQG